MEQTAVKSASTLLQDIKKEEKAILELQRNIDTKKRNIRSYKQALWTACNHEWIRDYFVSFDDKCKYYCKVCDLWKDKTYYFN